MFLLLFGVLMLLFGIEFGFMNEQYGGGGRFEFR